jgi:hypothetical protein
MLWVVLATMASALPQPNAAKVASTYDEAACAEAELRPIADDDGEINCSQPPPTVPAALDCNDARVIVWLGEMIGSCDMPLSKSGTALRAASSEQRLCRDGHCGVESVPIHTAARPLDHLTPILARAATLPLDFNSQSVDPRLTLVASQHGADRLERPPRA